MEKLAGSFKNLYGVAHSDVFFAPGRVNLIGEHIDYNGGLVMPAAIDMGTWLLIRPNRDGVLRFATHNYPQTREFNVASRLLKTGEEWYNYPLGVFAALQDKGIAFEGFDMFFSGNLPVGAGLSSSASIEVLTAFALAELLGVELPLLDLVKLAQSVENNFIGVNCGIMDQFAVGFGKKDYAMLLNCASLDYTYTHCDLQDYALCVINTNKPRKLSESKYNDRVAECTAGLHALQQELPIQSLCDLNTLEFDKHEHLITNPEVRKRARHAVEENDRVKLAAKALAAGDLIGFGALMYASHNSLKELYEVSGRELDTIVDFCAQRNDVAGARMTGAGFGGCAIALVKNHIAEEFAEGVSKYYNEVIGYYPDVYITGVADGVRRLAGKA